MSDYVIMTESSCDVSLELAQSSGMIVHPMKFTLDGKDYLNTLDYKDIDVKTVYDEMRAGKQVMTSAVNIAEASDAIEEKLREGLDVIWFAFSSALSSTYSNVVSASGMLKEKYPDRKILVVDTKCASLGEGLYVYLATKKKAEGYTIEQLYDWAEEIKLKICHWFTVDDLFHLKRGGRVSSATALVGSVLGIKPVLHVDNMGRLINMSKARGRKAAINALLEHMKETAIDPAQQTVFISHGDCLEDAEYLAGMIKEDLGVSDIYINVIGPVIGAHSGPGTLALFFIGTER